MASAIFWMEHGWNGSSSQFVAFSGSTGRWNHPDRADSDDARVLIFTSSPLSLELEVMAGHVVGQIVPPGPGEILVETSDGATFQVEADDIGFFELSGGPRGSVRLRCDTPAGRLITDWVCL